MLGPHQNQSLNPEKDERHGQGRIYLIQFGKENGQSRQRRIEGARCESDARILSPQFREFVDDENPGASSQADSTTAQESANASAEQLGENVMKKYGTRRMSC